MSGKPIQPELIQQDHNYLSIENGCEIIYASSQDPRAQASNILQNNEKKLWMTSNGLPQQCIISLKNIKQIPSIANVIGFYCWHQFDSNPSLIEVHTRSSETNQQGKWNLVTKIRLTLTDGWQYFKVQQIYPKKIREIRVSLIQNFGSQRTYLNRVALHYINFSNIIPTVRQSRSSTLHQKYTGTPVIVGQSTTKHHHNNININKLPIHSTQKQKPQSHYDTQLHKAYDKINKLSQEQQKMKMIITKQGQTIINLQEKIRTILYQLQKLYEIQQRKIYHSKQSASKGLYSQNDHDDYDLREAFNFKEQKNKTNPHKVKKMLKMLDQATNDPHYKTHHASVTKKVLKNSKKQTKLPPRHFSYNSLAVQQHQQQDMIHINSQQNFSEYSPQIPPPHTSLKKYPYKEQQTHSKTNNKQQLIQKIKLLRQLKQLKKSQMSSHHKKYYQSGSNKSINRSDKSRQKKSKYYEEQFQSQDDQFFRKVQSRKVKMEHGY